MGKSLWACTNNLYLIAIYNKLMSINLMSIKSNQINQINVNQINVDQ